MFTSAAAARLRNYNQKYLGGGTGRCPFQKGRALAFGMTLVLESQLKRASRIYSILAICIFYIMEP